MDFKQHIRAIPDFPKPGILFYDISTLLAHPQAWRAMIEIAPGLWHWTAWRQSIGSDVSSYYLARERVVIDPMIPPEGVDWFEEHGAPEHAVLSNRHHDRDSWRLREAFVANRSRL